MPEFEPPPAPPTIRCLHCNYDLRGLPGDPIRCPECGLRTSYADFSAKSVNGARAADYTFLALFALLLGCGTAIVAIVAPACGLAGLLPAVLGWLVLMLIVRRRAGGTPRWFSLCLSYQLLSAGLILSFLALVPLSIVAVIAIGKCIDAIALSPGMRDAVWLVTSACMLVLISAGFLLILERGGKSAQRMLAEINECESLRRK